MVAKRENYVDYIAHRPGVETYGKHGLFSDVNVPVDLLIKLQTELQIKTIMFIHILFHFQEKMLSDLDMIMQKTGWD